MKTKNVLEVNPGCGRILDALERVFIPDLRLNINSGILDSSAQDKRQNKCVCPPGGKRSEGYSEIWR